MRGAPALGVAGALGVALAIPYRRVDRTLAAARPTAVNLAWGVREAAMAADPLKRALEIREEDVRACREMGERGADLLAAYGASRVMTICNTGALATVERGTALGVIQTLHERGALTEAIALETRPLLQGARLTTWELQKMGAPFRLVVDSAGAFLAGAARPTPSSSGPTGSRPTRDTANKIGSYMLALGAHRAGGALPRGRPRDHRSTSGRPAAPRSRSRTGGAPRSPRCRASTPTTSAFDVTPAELITAIVTERRVVRPCAGRNARFRDQETSRRTARASGV